jgi:hypothetical protein
VQYFQYRKSRGSSEKFHGAVVDHVGNESTRAFREVADTGALLKKLDAVIGTTLDAKAALVFDWENMWALNDSKGMNNIDKGYEKTVIAHYLPFFKKGIAVDVIDQTKQLEKYKLVVAPMSYMLRPGFAERVSEFVKNGGVFVATYITGYVDEHDLCHLDGFPGPLKSVLGVWCEELDSLRPQDANRVRWMDSEYPVRDFAELTEFVSDSPTTGMLILGGGVPKNFTADTVVCGDILGKPVRMHKYAVQITVADPRDGALSGSTLKEAHSWGKIDEGAEQMVFCEATIALPILASYAYHKGSWHGRKEKRLARRFAPVGLLPEEEQSPAKAELMRLRAGAVG